MKIPTSEQVRVETRKAKKKKQSRIPDVTIPTRPVMASYRDKKNNVTHLIIFTNIYTEKGG